jgi:pyruvate/2-oxoglutarate/acetoin dehydrogenase E1 component
MSSRRNLKYSLAINEALTQIMDQDPSVLLMGQGVRSPWYVGETANGLLEKFGSRRVIDTPVSENAITGAAVGAAVAGMRPIVIHPRMDFMFFAFDPIINQAANWRYMSGGKSSCPIVFWGIVNRGGEQAAQHSQSLHGLFAHVPGLKVVMPSTPADAKGLLTAAILDPDPVVFIDDRWLYQVEDSVPIGRHVVPIGSAVVRFPGYDITIAGISYAAHLAGLAHEALAKKGISAEIVDLRSASPLDHETLTESVSKTGRALVVDGGWRSGGFAAEVSAVISECCFDSLETPVVRLTLPDAPAPAARSLEAAYYFGTEQIVTAALQLCSGGRMPQSKMAGR